MAREQQGNIIRGVEWIESMRPLLDDGYGLKIDPQGLSMLPFIAQGRDHVIVHGTQGRTLRRGDILLYRGAQEDVLILHRIKRIKNGDIYCLGDSQTYIEGPIPPDHIHAVATTLVRKGKEIDCNGRLYRLIAGLWLLTRPLRPLLFRMSGAFFRRKRKRDNAKATNESEHKTPSA